MLESNEALKDYEIFPPNTYSKVAWLYIGKKSLNSLDHCLF